VFHSSGECRNSVFFKGTGKNNIPISCRTFVRLQGVMAGA